MTEPSNTPGLGNTPRKDWPRVSKRGERPIDMAAPGTPLHAKLLAYFQQRLLASESKMSKFYPRWRIAELKEQAYVSLPDHEHTLKTLYNDKGAPPKTVPIIVPYGFATVATIQTFLLHTYCGRRPIFQVGTYNTQKQGGARKMETVMQYDLDHSRAIRHMAQVFQDISTYGLSILGSSWREDWKPRTVISQEPKYSLLGMGLGERDVRRREMRMVYQGNILRSIDPFMFFPDPNVPMVEVNKRGEFVFWRQYMGKHTLKSMEANGIVKWTDHAGSLPTSNRYEPYSDRGLKSEGDAFPGSDQTEQDGRTSPYRQADQGTITLIPRELGIGESEKPEKWIVTLLNKRQIVQLQPYDHDHDMHPVSVSEPYGVGYAFGQAGLMDYLGPIQDDISWFINSHKDNVRKALNDMFVVDPSAVEMQDMKNPNPGKLIRLKPSALGRDVRAVVSQLEVRDVTRSHISDANTFMRMGQFLSAVNDNVLGVQDFGGRKTATEVRTVGEAAASRLAALSRIISTHQMCDVAEQMCLNVQQYQTMEFALHVLGAEAVEEPQLISPGDLVGDFWYPVHDGTLPLDRVAMLDVWKEILAIVLQSDVLQQKYDVGDIFEHVAELGGAKNIERMEIKDIQEQPQIDAAAQAGNIVPASSLPGPSGLVNSIPERAADRARAA